MPGITLPLPASLAALLAVFGPLFTAPSFRTFCGMACGFLARAAGWFHDGSAAGPAKTGYGNNWVIAAIVVRLPFVNRPVALPVLAKLVTKDTTSSPVFACLFDEKCQTIGS